MPPTTLETLTGGHLAWLREQGRPAAIGPVRLVLRHRADHIDDELTRWRVGDLVEVVAEVIGASLAGGAAQPDEVVTAMETFLEYLDATGQLHAGSDPLGELLGALGEIGELADVMASGDVLGDVDDDALGGRLSLPPGFAAPPVRLAPEDELAAAARVAPAMARLAAFVAWVGDGRPLDDDGELIPADAEALAGVLGLDPVEPSGDPELDLVVEWAVEAGFVDHLGAALSPTRSGREIDAQPLAAWLEAFDALLELGVVDLGGNGPPWGQALDAGMPELVVLAHLRGHPMVLDELVELFWEQEADDFTELADGDPDVLAGLRQAVDEGAWQVVEALAGLGVVAVEGRSLCITPLGALAAVRLLRDDGHDVPVIGELAGADAARLLDECGEMEPDQAEAELAAWLEARNLDDAVGELANAARQRSAWGRRPMLLLALGQLGDAAAEAVRAQRSDPVLRPYATTWLIDRGLEDRHALSAEDMATLTAEQLAAILAVAGPDDLVETLSELGPPAEQVQAIEAIWRVEGPAVAGVLAAIGSHHRTKVVAKAARRAGFKRRSAGLS